VSLLRKLTGHCWLLGLSRTCHCLERNTVRDIQMHGSLIFDALEDHHISYFLLFILSRNMWSFKLGVICDKLLTQSIIQYSFILKYRA
jgi:hypothetical protein